MSRPDSRLCPAASCFPESGSSPRPTNRRAFSMTAEALYAAGPDHIPAEFVSASHLIYSSPATLAFNSPGAEGFGVKRAGLAVPGSVMLLVSPGCCGRNTALIGAMEAYRDRFFYLLMDETDIVTGRHLEKIPDAVCEVCRFLDTRPSVVMICITCVDALLGTDMERVCRKAEERAGLPVRPCYMYALTREGRRPPMVHVRQSIYSLLEPARKHADAVNLLGQFSPYADSTELYSLLRSIGIHRIREIARCRTYEEYQEMAQANVNLVLNPEVRFAAADFEKRLRIPSIELRRMYQPDKIRNQYAALGSILGASFSQDAYEEAARTSIARFRSLCPDAAFAVGEWMNGDAFELSLALVREGFSVKEIFGTVTSESFFYLKHLARLSPQTEIFSNLEPSMLYYDGRDSGVTITIGRDAAFHHPDCPAVPWNDEIQPFGYDGVRRLFDALCAALSGGKTTRRDQP